LSDLGFAFLDVETTGLDVRGNDRVVEIGVVLTDSQFRIEREFETLINPRRDVGPTSIHGISAADVLHAPDFSSLAPLIASLLHGRVVVGHNVRFDMSILDAEFRRAGLEVEWGNPICTILASSGAFRGKFPRRLSDLAAALGIEHELAHSALSDTKACMAVAQRIEQASPRVLTSSNPDDTFRASLPGTFDPVDCLTRSDRKVVQQGGTYIQTVVARIPAGYSGAKNVEYFEMLDRALADFDIDQQEKNHLVSLAETLGLAIDDIDQAHQAYVREMALSAKADGEISDTERKQIYRVAELLGVSTLFCEQNLVISPEDAKSEIAGISPKTLLTAGKVVLLTGDMDPNKEHFESKFKDLGLVIASGISKKVDVLFAGDPASQSGKAVKARQYGIPVLSIYDWELYVS
jgi:DNA polymerase III subunit epsilon